MDTKKLLKLTDALANRLFMALWKIIARNKVFILLIIGLAQCLSIWNYQGEKVDESELVHFAVGFLGGDLDPHWYGYGSFGMYFLGAIYLIIGKFLILLGAFQDTVAFSSILYDSGFFQTIGRYVFACLGVISVYVYGVIARQNGVPLYVLVLFFFIGTMGADSLGFANYIRADQIVCFLFALLIYCLLSAWQKRTKIVVSSLLMAAVVCVKINAISCLPLLLVYNFFLSKDFKQRVKDVVFSLGLFSVGTILFQPFQSLIRVIYNSYALRIGSDLTFNYSKPIHSGFLEHLQAICQIYLNYLSLPVVVSLVFIPFIFRRYFRLGVSLIAFIVLYIFTFFFSWEVTDYWFLPTFLPIKLLACLAVYAFLEYIIPSNRVFYLRYLFGLITFFYLAFSGLPRYFNFSHRTLTQGSNKISAKNWLCQMSDVDTILIDAHYDHVLPKIFRASTIDDNRLISDAFIYGRDKNMFLQTAFKLFLDREQKRCGRIQNAELVRAFDPLENELESHRRRNRFMMVSPSVYNRFLGNPGLRYTEDKMKELKTFQNYYQMIISNELVKRFDAEDGPVIEVYHLK